MFIMFSVDVVSADSDIVEELEGADREEMSPSTPERLESPGPASLERKQTTVLDVLQKETGRRRLLNPGGMFLHSSTYLLQYTTLSELP